MTNYENDNLEHEFGRPLLNSEILDYATQHDLPIFDSMDGSLNNKKAPVSISIIAPDIRDNDMNNEWQNRIAKPLLIRSWELSNQWGTSNTYINMAEAIGFIIREYTVPQDLPIIYITDSSNARTLQQNLCNRNKFMHRKLIRSVKQGIDHSIANHIENLTSRWMREDQINTHTEEVYERVMGVYKIWAN